MEQKPETIKINVLDIIQSKEFEDAISAQASQLQTAWAKRKLKIAIDGGRIHSNPIDKLGVDGKRLADDYAAILMKQCKEPAAVRNLIQHCGNNAISVCFAAIEKAHVAAVEKAKSVAKTKAPRKKAKAQA